MNLALSFSPLVPLWLMFALTAGAAAIVGAGLFTGARGALLRAFALAFLLLALAGPTLDKETRQPLNDIVTIVADRSMSQATASRTAATNDALAQLKQRLEGPNIDLRVIDATSSPDEDGTRLFSPLKDAIKDVPADRLGAVILLTDGEVHDVPSDPKSLGLSAPVHTLITGERGEADRKLTIVEAPRFGIVGHKLSFIVRVDDLGAPGEAKPATAVLSMRIDGGVPQLKPIETGRPQAIEFELTHGGENVVELEAGAGPHELTMENNRAVIAANGVRDRLRVLLVSGEPHAGERTWRNLLKADPSVDLVHFTILRPPEKSDGTDERDLALIGFPVRDLFSVKLYDFDLIIFDRYRRREVIPPTYFGFMADYVESGGALLVASGPDFNSGASIAETALAPLLPTQPTERVFEEGFRPHVSELGFRHPVTAGLPGANTASGAEASWGRWFRLADTDQRAGEVLMTGPRERPLLVLDTAGKGRVAQLLSDQAWLWARGFEGGGPQAELLRRLAHWLMKEPDLEEELLAGAVHARNLEVTRRTMADAANPVNIQFPSGKTQTLDLKADRPGSFVGHTEIDEMGLYHLSDGRLSAIVAVGPLNPKETSDMRATEDLVKPVASATGGGIYWIGSKSGARNMPGVRFVGKDRTAAGTDWLGIRRNGGYVVTAIEQTPLFPPALALALVCGFLLLAWRRESR
ncbi:MAG: hypothetical protein U1E87_04180 [Alphaproteobacteria bacterium]